MNNCGIADGDEILNDRSLTLAALMRENETKPRGLPSSLTATTRQKSPPYNFL